MEAAEFYKTMWNSIYEGTDHKQFSYKEMIEFANEYYATQQKPSVPSSGEFIIEKIEEHWSEFGDSTHWEGIKMAKRIIRKLDLK